LIQKLKLPPFACTFNVFQSPARTAALAAQFCSAVATPLIRFHTENLPSLLYWNE
jgi:hypothetical protein